MIVSHIVDVVGLPWCGEEPNEAVSITELQVDDPDVCDAVEFCSACIDIVYTAAQQARPRRKG